MEALIQAESLCKTYNRHRPDEFEALTDISFEIKPGEVVVLKGPSGSGKTSLLSLLGCLARPTSGRILVEGKDVARLPERFLAGIRREAFGFIFQQFNLLRDLSVSDNILLPLYPSELKVSEMKERAAEVLDKFGLIAKASMKVRQLSGGEQQRVAIARALINRPRIIMADEPTAHLDSRLADDLLEILSQLKKAGKTIVIATHDPAVYGHPLIDRSYLMHHGAMTEEVSL